jgi:hypothetical protein
MVNKIKTMRKILLTLILIIFSLSIFAQDDVTIILVGNRKIEKTPRITVKPVVIDTVIPLPEVQYPLLSLKYETTLSLDTIEAANVKLKDILPQLYSSYARVGIGSVLMPLGELYFNSTRSRKYMYGAHLNHLSSFGTIKGYAPSQFDRTSLKTFGGINEKKYTLRGDINWSNRGFHQYGFQNENADRDSIANRFNEIGTAFSFASHKKDSANLNYKVGFSYRNFIEKKSEIDSLKDWRARENFVGITSSFWYKLGKEVFATDLNIFYNGYRYGERDTSLSAIDTSIWSNNTVIQLKPTITTTALDNKLKATVGVDVSIDAGINPKVYIYPIAEAHYSLFDNIFIPYAGIKGGLTQNSYRDMSLVNEFMLSNVEMRNEHNAIQLYLGFKGTITKTLGFNVNARFGNYKNKALFITDTLLSNRNQFRVIYDTMNITTIEGSLFYQAGEKLKVDAVARFNSYSAFNNTYAWNLPQLEFVVRGSYNLYSKFLVNLDLNLFGGRRALVYEKEENTTLENNQYAKSLGFIADANLSVEYRYTKRISAFIQLNNFAAQRYQRWYNYPVQGFQVMGGVTFRF